MNIATINPFRYRGYYFDTESNFYYLQSRYYDPVVGRFINADDAELLGFANLSSCNLYAYCKNNAVNGVDLNGKWVITASFSISGALAVGFSISATIAADNRGHRCLLIAVAPVFGISTFGFGFSCGFFWRFKTVDQYINSWMAARSYGAGIGITLYELRDKERYISKGISGIELSTILGVTYSPISYTLCVIPF